MKQIALLRAINVSGKNKIIMEELRKLFKNLDFTDIETYIQSGNVVFNSVNDIKINQKLIKENIKTFFGLDVEVIVLYEDKLEEVIDNSFFLKEDYDKKALYYCFLSSTPSKDILEEIKIKATLDEEMILINDILYLYYPNGMGKSKIVNTLIESKLKIFSTIRNHNTVIKLNELVKK